jgi:hypothetical protein
MKNAAGQFVGYAPNSGDYNADGDTNVNGVGVDYPDILSYSQKHGHSDYLSATGIFNPANFPQPVFGTEGNERFNQFTGPGFQEWDAALLKNTPIHEGISFQLRFELYNVFNHSNLNSVVTDLSRSNFGQATAQAPPRSLQIGGNLTF